MVEVLDSGTFYSNASECKTPRVDFTGCESDLILMGVKSPFSLNLNHAERMMCEWYKPAKEKEYIKCYFHKVKWLKQVNTCLCHYSMTTFTLNTIILTIYNILSA